MLCLLCQDRLCPLLGLLGKRGSRIKSMLNILGTEESVNLPVVGFLTSVEMNEYVSSGCPMAQYLKDHMIRDMDLRRVDIVVMVSVPFEDASLLRGELHVVEFQISSLSKVVPITGRLISEVFANEDNQIAPYILGRPVDHGHRGSEMALDLARRWLWTCIRGEHPHCIPTQLIPRPSTLPSRLIKVWCDVKKDRSAVRLCVCTPSNIGYYATLSYCWGGGQSLVTTKANLKDMLLSIPLVDLPQTIYDAIHVTRKLGLEYIWIDSLCIIQDSEVDKRNEIAKMGRIYRNSILTITADRAKDCHDGFLSRSEKYAKLIPKSISREIPYCTSDGKIGSVLLRECAITPPEPQPIHDRGWAYQEAFFAQRMLSFGERMTWRCASGRDASFGSGSHGPFHPNPFHIPKYELQDTALGRWGGIIGLLIPELLQPSFLIPGSRIEPSVMLGLINTHSFNDILDQESRNQGSFQVESVIPRSSIMRILNPVLFTPGLTDEEMGRKIVHLVILVHVFLLLASEIDQQLLKSRAAMSEDDGSEEDESEDENEREIRDESTIVRIVMSILRIPTRCLSFNQRV